MEDGELLREYIERQSEQAFAELVARHVNLVYSAALRVVREPQMAQDVAQATFALLARKAGSLREPNAVGGWLYRTACNSATSLLRAEQRRHQREAEAVNRAELNADANAAWETIGPLLEEAMRQLKPAEQDALVLRYFEEKSLREAGCALALSEDAVQKRVSRALDKLRAHFARRGVTISAAMLVAAMSAHAAQAAPVGLAGSLATTALAGAGSAAAESWVSLLKLLAMTKLQATTLGLLFVAGMATPMLLDSRATTPARAPLAAAPRSAPSNSARPLTKHSPTPAAAVSNISPGLSQLEAWLRKMDRMGWSMTEFTEDLDYMLWSLPAADYPRAWALREGLQSPEVRRIFQFEVLKFWSETEPRAAAAAAQSIPLDWRGVDAANVVLWNWGAQDPKAALAWAQESFPEGLRLVRIHEAIDGITRTDPAAALAASQQLLTPGLSTAVMQGIMDHWASREPAAAAVAVMQMPPSRQRAYAFQILVRNWKELDPEAAQKWLDQTSLTKEKEEYLRTQPKGGR